ncbi:MAG TPA: hypothetical protein VFS02_11145 [Telluria sp.]|nr:hypothetical protein [Telluria sp.]
MRNTDKPGATNPPAGADPAGYVGSAQSRQRAQDNAGAGMQYAAPGSQGAPAGAGAAAALGGGGGGPQITLAQAQLMALQITTCFEGGKSMNYQALADNFDEQIMSFGLIQWNFGQNTLGPLLKKMLARDAARFAACFGPSTDYAVLKAALDGDDEAGQKTWTLDLLQRDKPAWRAAFQAVGAVDEFNAIQREQAAAEYHPLVMRAVDQLRHVAPALMRALEFRSYAALFDLCVQQHSITKALDEIQLRAKSEKPASQLDLLKIAVVERAKVAGSDWQSDCISRRMGILTGVPYESTEHGVTKKRTNPQLALALQFGAARVVGL